MLKTYCTLILTSLLMLGRAWADPAVSARDFKWPTTYTPFKVVSVPIEVQWKEGRPFASRSDLAKYLHIAESGDNSVDLIEALSERGFLVRRDHDGTIQAVYPTHGATSGGPAIRHSEESARAIIRFESLLQKEHKVWLKSDPRNAMLNRIGQDVAAQSRRPIPWVFAIVADREPNAASTGEGVAYVTTGLLDMGFDADEIAGILGHEVAHGARQHLEADRIENSRKASTNRQIEEANTDYQRAQREYARASSEQSRTSNSSESTTLSQSMADSDLEWAQRKYHARMSEIQDRKRQHRSYEANSRTSSHTQERDSDIIGQGYATAAGYRADGLVRALEKLGQRDARFGLSGLMGSQTHPPIAERIARLRRILGSP